MTSSKRQGLGLRALALLAALGLGALLVSCGGGGGGGNAATTFSSYSNNPGATGASALQQSIASCTQQNTPAVGIPSSGNSTPVVVDFGPCAIPTGSTSTSPVQVGTANVPFTNVTICVPGTNTCQTIDHVMVDTGSSGLRIMSSVLVPALNLPAVNNSNGVPLIECVQFADGYSWGSVRSADVRIVGEHAASLPIQVIGDSASDVTPSTCLGTSGTLVPLNDVSAFGANGVLGVGLFAQDCGPYCATTLANTFYYTCPTASTCAPSTAQLTQQTTNPDFAFGGDGNGVVLSMPALASASGTNNSVGTLVFGINTQSNNQATSSAITLFQSTCATFYSTLTSISNGYTGAGIAYANSFIDSGSNGLYLPGTNLETDAHHWFAPTAANVVQFQATQQGQTATALDANGNCLVFQTGTVKTVAFSIANADTVLFTLNGGNDAALNGLGGPSSAGTINTGGIDWGLPFFYGRSVFVGLEAGTNNPSVNVAGSFTPGPFWAY